MRIDSMELLGAERLLYGTLLSSLEKIIVRVAAESATDATANISADVSPQIGDTIYVQPRAGKLHYFDVATGKRL